MSLHLANLTSELVRSVMREASLMVVLSLREVGFALFPRIVALRFPGHFNWGFLSDPDPGNKVTEAREARNLCWFLLVLHPPASVSTFPFAMTQLLLLLHPLVTMTFMRECHEEELLLTS